jgi:integrase
MAINLTARVIESKLKEAIAKPDGLYLWDSKLKGFGVRLSPKGRVTWLVQKSVGSRENRNHIRVVVGHMPEVSLEDARTKAGQTIVDIANGVDVQSVKSEKQAALQVRLDAMTVREAVTEYLAERRGDRRRSQSDAYEKKVRANLEAAVEELGPSRRINTVSKADVRGVLKTRKDAGYFEAARWMFSQLRPFFDWCVHEEYLAVSPCVGVVPPSAGEECQHKLNDAEIVALWSCATADVNMLGDYYRVLLLTAQRRTEVASMQWQELNLDKAEWIIPASKTKNGREHLVPLSPLVISILNGLPKRKLAEYVFGKYARAPVSGFSKAKRELDAAMLLVCPEMRPWRLHDLRRTAASGMKALKVQPHVIEAILNHTPSKLQQTYQVHDLHEYYEEKRHALSVWANRIDVILGGQKPDNIIPFVA